MIEEIRRQYKMIKDLPPIPTVIRCSHSVPFGRVYHQWDTRDRLIIWVNRGEMAEYISHMKVHEYGIMPNALDTSYVSSIPLSFE